MPCLCGVLCRPTSVRTLVWSLWFLPLRSGRQPPYRVIRLMGSCCEFLLDFPSSLDGRGSGIGLAVAEWLRFPPGARPPAAASGCGCRAILGLGVSSPCSPCPGGVPSRRRCRMPPGVTCMLILKQLAIFIEAIWKQLAIYIKNLQITLKQLAIYIKAARIYIYSSRDASAT